MRITVDIDASQLDELRHEAGVKGKAPAVRKAIEAYLKEIRKRKLVQRVMEGKTDYGRTNEELEAMVTHDPH